MAIEWGNPGLAAMVQGIPYRGHRHIGMPLCGAADPVSLALANWLAGNTAETPAIETAFAAASFTAMQDMTVGIAGAHREVKVNGTVAADFESISLSKGDEVHIGPAHFGCRSYIAVKGGFTADSLLGGNSTYAPAGLGGSARHPIVSGNVTPAAKQELQTGEIRSLPDEYRLRFSDHFILRILDSPEAGLAGSMAQRSFTVSRRTDRIGVELKCGKALPEIKTAMQSSAVFPGTIQYPPSGKPFLLGPDAQTTGGYPRIAQVTRADRHLIGQLRPEAKVTLQRITVAPAHSLYSAKLELLRKLQPGLRLD